MRKKLFAVIMSVMMMVTFMPMMAFATDCTSASHEGPFAAVNGKFDTTYSSYSVELVCDNCHKSFTTETIKPGTYFTRTWNNDGKIDVSVNVDGYLNSIYGTVDTSSISNNTASYYDLTGATVQGANPMEADAYLDMIKDNDTDRNGILETSKSEDVASVVSGITLVKPSYLSQAGAPVVTADADLSVLDIAVTKADYEVYGDNKEYSFPVSVKATESTDDTDVVGTLDTSVSVAINVLSTTTFTHTPWTVDNKLAWSESDEDGILVPNLNIVGQYVGQDQGFKAEAKNVTIEYALYDETKSEYGEYSTTAPVIKDVISVADTTNEYKFKVKVSKKITNYIEAKGEYEVSYEVYPAGLTIGFEKSQFTFGLGQEIKKSDLVVAKAIDHMEVPRGELTSNAYKTHAVYEADKAMVDQIIDKYFTVNGIITTKGSSDLSLNYDEYNAMLDMSKDKDYAQFGKNYTLLLDDDVYWSGNSTGLLKWNAGLIISDQENDITAPNQTKTIKYKKLKKKSQTFQLKAKADWGTLSFTKMSGNSKIKVNSTGKVTVKKGLKKGKYVVKVKVKAPNAKATKKLTVKVK